MQKQLKKHLENFDFVFQVVIHSIILESTNLVSQVLQKSDVDLSKATALLKNATNELSNFRNSFDDVMVTAVAIAQQWGVETEFRDKRSRKIKKHFDKLAEDERLSNPTMYFKTTVFYGTLDIIINKINFRFEGMNNLTSLFVVLTPEFLSSETDKQLYSKANQLCAEYDEDLSQEFASEIQSFRLALREDINSRKSVREVADLLFIDNFSLACSIPNVCTAYLLFLTLPVTVATAERTFSKLKLIKNYLRSSISQERLSGLSILSVECDIAKSIDLSEVIQTFASQNAIRSRRFQV